jgi:hypothetical protein
LARRFTMSVVVSKAFQWVPSPMRILVGNEVIRLFARFNT